jgi:hypothetical protein
MELINS